MEAKSTLENRVRGYSIGFLVIGVAIGMVIMNILFLYFEATIKSWDGFSWLAFPLLLVYVLIASVLTFSYHKRVTALLSETRAKSK